LRLLACDAAVVPIVMNGAGQPLDVGRAKRTIPDGLRRAVAARDRGCARCGRPPSWCEIHHIIPVRHEALDFRVGVRDPHSRAVTAVPGKLRAA
jgi:uncharacterized protein DUF222